MKIKKTIVTLFFIIIILFIGGWLVRDTIFFDDNISSRAKKVFYSISRSDYYE